MNETEVTVQGFVGTKPELRHVGGTVVAGFRVASTPRYFSSTTNAWADRDTNWFTVNAWRALGEGCVESLNVGEPVIVRGRLRTQSWTDEAGNQRVTCSLDAMAVGHDLSRGGSTAFVPREKPRTVEEDPELGRLNDQWSPQLPPMDGFGNFRADAEPPPSATVPDDVASLTSEAEAAPPF